MKDSIMEVKLRLMEKKMDVICSFLQGRDLELWNDLEARLRNIPGMLNDCKAPTMSVPREEKSNPADEIFCVMTKDEKGKDADAKNSDIEKITEVDERVQKELEKIFGKGPQKTEMTIADEELDEEVERDLNWLMGKDLEKDFVGGTETEACEDELNWTLGIKGNEIENGGDEKKRTSRNGSVSSRRSTVPLYCSS